MGNSDKYFEKNVYMIGKILVLFAAINTGLYKLNSDYNILGLILRDRALRRTFYIFIVLVAIYLMFRRETYLPFLGESVVPYSVFTEKINPITSITANPINIKINTPNAEKVIWWAASEDQHKVAQTPEEAYNEYENSGVSNVSKDGTVSIVFPCPTQYKIPSGRILKKHLHYRETHGGMLSEVKTINLDC